MIIKSIDNHKMVGITYVMLTYCPIYHLFIKLKVNLMHDVNHYISFLVNNFSFWCNGFFM